MALGALREEGMMAEESPLLPALWEGVVSVVLLSSEYDQQLAGKGLEPYTARVSFVLVSCLHQPHVCLVTVSWLLPLAV